MRQIPALVFTIMLAACGTLPDIPEPQQALDSQAEYPTFVQISDVVAEQAAAEEAALETEETIATRVAGLRARAARLRAVEVE